MKSITLEEVARHTSEQDCWIIIKGKVYDVTNFFNEHPGGKKVLLKVAGRDASSEFDTFHAPSILDKFGPQLLIGAIGASGVEIKSKPAEQEDVQPLVGLEDGDAFGAGIPFGDPTWYGDAASPYYKESHRKVRSFVRNWVEKHAIEQCGEWDEKKQLPRDIFIKAAKAGILQGVVGAAHLPPKYFEVPFPAGVPADEWDSFHELIVCDELCRTGSGGFAWGLFGGLGIGLPPIIKFGSDYLKDKVVKECLAGRKNICLAITEPSGGSDVANLVTEAKLSPCKKFFVVNGTKKWITNGDYASYFTVAVRTGGAGMSGITLVLIEREMPGVSTRHMDCMGVWSSGTSFVSFEDVKVPVENIIGEENKGFKLIMSNFNHERMGIVIQANRFSRVCYEDSIKYAHKRKTFGKLLIEHPVIRNKLAHMARKIEATHAWMESLIFQTLHMPEEIAMLKLGGPIALLKAQATDTFEFCAREAAQIFGGLSYSRGGQGGRVERLYREVRAYAIPGGSEEIMLDLGIKQSIKVAQFLGAKI